MNNIFGRVVPLLGFGCMRLPENEDGEYIAEECQAMFDYAMTHGINYFDSAWHYIESQLMVGQCLKKYPRDSYILVGKLCFYDGTLHSREEAEKAFQKELADCRTSYMDLELIHALGNPGSIKRVDELDIWGFMQDLKKSGRVKHIGISFHSWPEDLERILTQHPEIEAVQIQANYYDHNSKSSGHVGASYEVYEICRKHNKPIIVMEPIKGGNLAKADRHPEIAQLFTDADPTQNAVSWALRYAASLEGVITVLSGMSTLKQMEENHHILMEDFTPLTKEELAMLQKAGSVLEEKMPIGCTACCYCVDNGCPAGIDIPRVIEPINMAEQYKDMAGARLAYYLATNVLHQANPDDCIRCGACEKACPQGLPVMELIHQAGEIFGNSVGNPWGNQ